jgi:hypothetical protein
MCFECSQTRIIPYINLEIVAKPRSDIRFLGLFRSRQSQPPPSATFTYSRVQTMQWKEPNAPTTRDCDKQGTARQDEIILDIWLLDYLFRCVSAFFQTLNLSAHYSCNSGRDFLRQHLRYHIFAPNYISSLHGAQYWTIQDIPCYDHHETSRAKRLKLEGWKNIAPSPRNLVGILSS